MESSTHQDRSLFVDAHVHIKNSDGIASILSAGIAAVRDAGLSDRSWSAGGGRVQRPGFPVVISAERALYKKNGYGSWLGTAVDQQDEIKSEILKLKKAGAGIIKVIASGLVSLSEPGRITPGGFNREELFFIVREAGKHGLFVMAHANGEAAIVAAAEAGVRSVEHGFSMTGHALDVMAKQGTFWTPTVGALARAADVKTLSGEMKDSLSAQIQIHLTMISRARSMGVSLAIGTDCMLPDPAYRNIYDQELSYFEQAGIDQEDVLMIACKGGARLLGI